MKILERLGIHRLSKYDRSVLVNSKPISYVFGVYMTWFLMYHSKLDHDLMVNIKKTTTHFILLRNLNSGLSYLTKARPNESCFTKII